MATKPTSSRRNPELIELGALPQVHLGSVARGGSDFAFVLQNVTSEEVTVKLVAQDQEVTLAEQEATLAPRSEHQFFGRVDTTDLSLGRQRFRVQVYTPEGVGTVGVHLRVASVALPAVLFAAYFVMIIMGMLADSDFLVTLGFSACIIVAVLLWQRLKGWHFPALGLSMALVYLALPHIRSAIYPSEDGAPPPLAPVVAFEAKVVEDGVQLFWEPPAGEDGQANACIVCKRGPTPPEHMSDGRSVFMDKVGIGTFMDTSPLVAGVVYTYAIFVCEPGKPSRFSPQLNANVLFVSPSEEKKGKAKADAKAKAEEKTEPAVNSGLPLRVE